MAAYPAVRLGGTLVRGWILFLVFLGCGCSQQPLRPAGIDQYQAARVQVDSRLAGVEDETQQLAEMVIKRLRDQGIFQRVEPGPGEDSASSTLHVQLTLLALRRSSDGRRIALGESAPSNEVRVQVFLSDGHSGKALSAFQLQGVSPGRTGIRIEWPWGSVEAALQQVSDQLGQRLAEWRRGGS